MLSNFRHKLQKIFIAGILTVLPLTITYLLLRFLFNKLDSIFQPIILDYIDRLYASGVEVTYIPGLGIAATVTLILIVGLIVTNVLGKKILEMMEAVLARIPLVRNIYIASKQFLETISLANTADGEFNKVVLVEYPRKGLYSLGFVTCESSGEPQLVTREEVVNVFIPTTPNPTSGMLIMVPKKDLIPLSMTIEEGLKLVVSAGIVTPELNNNNNNNKYQTHKKWSWFRRKQQAALENTPEQHQEPPEGAPQEAEPSGEKET